MRLFLPLVVCLAAPAFSQDARQIVRRSVELDQANWIRMADYTWVGRSRERHFDSHNQVTSEHSEAWESFILDGQPFHRMLEREGKPIPAAEKQKQEQQLDKATAKLESETPEEKQRRADDYQKKRRRERAFLLEISDAFDFHLEGTEKIDGQDTWVISGTPKPGYHPKSRDGAALLKIHGKIWIEQAGYEWVRIEAQTTATISFGWFLARLNPGAKLFLEQERINEEVWLPKREYMVGSGRIGLVKRLAEDFEVTWNDYKKYRVESKITTGQP
jgi:hypothetical protein